MGTTQKTDSSNQSNLQFDPSSLGNYKNLTGAGSNVLLDYMKNPLNNQTYNLGLQSSLKGANQAGNNNMQALMQMMKTSGLGGTAGQGFQGAQQAQTGRANASMTSQAKLTNIQQALSRQMAATGMGMSFSPLMTGQSGTSSQTQSTGGLGTWLPQVLGAAAGGAMNFATGGMSGAMGGMFGGGSVGGQSNPGLGSPSYMPGGSPYAPPPSFMGAGMGGSTPPPAWLAGGF